MLDNILYEETLAIEKGIAIKKPKCKILCIDGDGSLIMHMGSLSTIGQLAPKNFYHILINNYAYESVGGQPTSSEKIVLDKIARYNGYNRVFSITDLDELKDKIPDFFNIKGPCFLELISKIGSRKNLGRPNIKPIDNKVSFMDHLKSL